MTPGTLTQSQVVAALKELYDNYLTHFLSDCKDRLCSTCGNYGDTALERAVAGSKEADKDNG